MNHFLHQAINLNNNGVSYLVSGNEKCAVASFAKSLSTIKKILASKISPTAAADVTSTMYQPCRYHSEVSLPYLSQTTIGHQFVYDKAVTIHLAKDADDEDEVENILLIYSACVILNLAIVHHRAAVSRNSTLLFQKAHGFYQTVHTLLRKQFSMRGEHEPNETLMLLKIVALNNQCHVYMVLDNYEKSREGVKELLELISSNEAMCRPLFTTEEWSGLLVNAMSIMYLYVAAAAA